MIARIAGRLEEVATGSVLVDGGGAVWYELYVPACDIERLSRKVGQDVVLHTIHYMEGDPTRGQMAPRLIGFLSEGDRGFFKVFTTVKGIGVRKALRALVRPVGEIAAAIQARDVKFLKALPEIGPRTADRVVAELNGKVDEFAADSTATSAVEMPEAASEAVAVLVQVGERRGDATALVERVLAVAPDLDTPEEIIQQVYKIKAAGK